MDGLIKGLIDVALGHNDDRDEERNSESREDRSRSTWAEVVSGEQDNDEPSGDRRHGHDHNQWNKEEQEQSYGRNEEWESGGSRPSMRPHKAVQEGYERNEDSGQADYKQGRWNRKDEEENNDGWQTVCKKPPKQPHEFYLEEAKGRVDYQGYIFPRRRGEIPDSETQLLTIQFEWNGVLKSVSSTLIGVSPEFEIALYTLCFYMGREDNHVQLGPYSVNVKCYRLGNKIGSAFPIAEC
ncbi:hypothetical protein CsSME_00049927 [Camellia sinensis var. sinensis]